MSRKRSKGRGRLSTIDLLPDVVSPDVAWAADELISNKRTQADILAEFNERLSVHGVPPVSLSAFNRHSIQLAVLTKDMQETQMMTDAVVARLGPDKSDNLTLGLTTLLKQAIFKIRANGGDLDPESLLSLSRSVQALTSAQKTSADIRRTAQAEIEVKLKAAAKAVQAVGKERGFSKEALEAVSAGIMGVAK